MKACTQCGAVKPLEEFHRFVNGADGHRAECKACALARSRAGYVPRPPAVVAAVCAYPPCAAAFEYVRSSGRERMYCSQQCKFRNGDLLKRDRAAALPPRACPCGSTNVMKVGKPVCPNCRKDPRDNAANRVRERRRILKLYNITQADYDRMAAAQGDRCATCNTDSPGDRGESWSIDHDHRCCPGKGSCGRCVRGLLCSSCNLAIGQTKDSPDLLRAMAAYIEAARQPALFAVA